jgi:hypothetical protein
MVDFDGSVASLILNPTQGHLFALLIPVISRWFRLLVRNMIM